MEGWEAGGAGRCRKPQSSSPRPTPGAPFNKPGAAAVWKPARDVTWPRVCFKDMCHRLGKGQADSGAAEGAGQNGPAAGERRGGPQGRALGPGARRARLGPPLLALRPALRSLKAGFVNVSQVCLLHRPAEGRLIRPRRSGHSGWREGHGLSVHVPGGRWCLARKDTRSEGTLNFLRPLRKQSFKNFSSKMRSSK